MKNISLKRKKRNLRHRRSRSVFTGTAQRPRVAVFRSNKHIYAQLIDDENSLTLLGVSSSQIEDKDTKGKKKTEIAFITGSKLGDEAKKRGIKEIVFDRGGFAYHGRVKAVAEGIRESGLSF